MPKEGCQKGKNNTNVSSNGALSSEKGVTEIICIHAQVTQIALHV